MSAPFGGASPKKARRTGQPVRRHSYNVGEREHRIWRPIGRDRQDARRFSGALMRAAKKLDRETYLARPEHRRRGELGKSGLAVLEALLEMVNFRTGRLDPSIAMIAEKSNQCVRTVVRALARLKAIGIIDWLRRTVRTDNEGAGPQVQQTSNAYWFTLKGRVNGIWRLITGKAPPGTRSREEVQAEVTAERADQLAAMRHQHGGRLKAADILAPEAKEGLARLQAYRARSASDSVSKNPGVKG